MDLQHPLNTPNQASNFPFLLKMLPKQFLFQIFTSLRNLWTSSEYCPLGFQTEATKFVKSLWVSQAAWNRKGLSPFLLLSVLSNFTSTGLWSELTFGRWKTIFSENLWSQAAMHKDRSSRLSKLSLAQVNLGLWTCTCKPNSWINCRHQYWLKTPSFFWGIQNCVKVPSHEPRILHGFSDSTEVNPQISSNRRNKTSIYSNNQHINWFCSEI